MSYLPHVILFLLVLLALWGAWMGLVARLYRPVSARPRILRARCRDGWEVALHFRPAIDKRYQEPILLSHGFAANCHTFDFDPPHSLAHALSEAGFDCYTVEWRGTGHSRRPPRRQRWGDHSVDEHIHLDAPAVVDKVLEHSEARQLYWLGHSLGALIGYAFAQGPDGQKLKGLIALGAPLFFHFDPTTKAAARLGWAFAWPAGFRLRLLSLTLAPFLGYVTLPLSDVIINPKAIPPPLQRKVYANLICSVSRRVMLQFQDWILHDAFRSYDKRVDYRRGIPDLTLPFLVMGGSMDRLAPPSAVRAQFELIGSQDKTLAIFGPERGERLAYGHGDLLYGEHAPTEVYPVILRWLEARATRVGRSQAGVTCPTPLPA